jgi:hypothetical protein
MPPKVWSTNEVEENFRTWVAEIMATDAIAYESRRRIAHHVVSTRHLMITDARQFYTDALKSGVLDGDYPITISCKGQPLALIESFEEVQEAVDKCKSIGCSYDFHIYESVSQRIH